MVFNNIIEFSIHKNLAEMEVIKPYPIKKTLPEWFKKIEVHSVGNKNIKGCIPFLDGISAGYVLPLPQDFHLSYNIYNPKTEKKQSSYGFAFGESFFKDGDCFEYNLNTNMQQQHPVDQVGGLNSFLARKNGQNDIIKILNPWKIKTPPGYSCLFVAPFYNEMDYFYIINAIVDTDRFDDCINFPIIINNDKYPSFKKTFKQGTPYVQIIPFKREPWKFKTKSFDKNIMKNKFDFFSKIINRYKTLIWERKKWN